MALDEQVHQDVQAVVPLDYDQVDVVVYHTFEYGRELDQQIEILV